MNSILASIFSPRKASTDGELCSSPLTRLKPALSPKKAKRKSLPAHRMAKFEIVTEESPATPSKPAMSKSPVRSAARSPRRTPSQALSVSQIIHVDPVRASPEAEAPGVMTPTEEEVECAFECFDDHRWDGDAIQIHVQWEGGESTWEDEITLHQDAPEALLDYWKSVGGRPLNPRKPDFYTIYAIRKHSKDRKNLLVEWVGYGPNDASWVPRAVVQQSAPELVNQYWQTIKPGRPRGRRGRGKKA